MSPKLPKRTRRRLLRVGSGTFVAGVAGCLGLRSDEASRTETSSNSADPEADETPADGGTDDTSTPGDCDPGESIVTEPDGDAGVSVTLRESISYNAPKAEVILDVSRVEFEGADVPSVAYEVDRRLDLWTNDDEWSDEEFTVVEREPIPVGTYRELRVYGTIVDAELADAPEASPTVRLADGDVIADTFGTVFEAGDRTEFTKNVVRRGDENGFELDFSGGTTTSW